MTQRNGQIGLSHEGSRFLGIAIAATEPLAADLCRGCGTVVRFYVKRVDCKWNEAPKPRDG